jgi:S-adenosylmethionine:tRNA ribosyltransferase-isomerase
MDQLYSFDLPEELIAQAPATPRDHARLLVYNRKSKSISDDHFYNLAKHLEPNTLVVANNTKVDHCRYLFHDGKTEIFVTEAVNDNTVRAMIRPGKKFKLGESTVLDNGLVVTTTHIDEDGIRTLRFNLPRDDARLVRASHVPLPPYISQNDTLADEYQTIYAKRQGSLAAPTAGLHFTPELQKSIAEQFGWAEVTLDVGLGTFASLSEQNFASGTLHAEHYHVDMSTYDQMKDTLHVTAIGTTTLRTLEYIFSSSEPVLDGNTDIFIRPGYKFARVDSLITNFHLPSTSLLLLVEAFLGSRSELEQIYTHAIKEKYRFYSFGDAMLII